MSDWKILQPRNCIAPDAAGLYVFYNDTGELFYIGSSYRLKNRVATQKRLFNPHTIKIKIMGTIDPFLKLNPEDALNKKIRALENRFIFKVKPKLNILLLIPKNKPCEETLPPDPIPIATEVMKVSLSKSAVSNLQKMANENKRTLCGYIRFLLEQHTAK
jgi:excinuclease UvrABC nuclease subunit